MFNGREDHFMVKMTPRVVDQAYIQALEEVAQTPFPGKVALVVVRNHERARNFMRKIDKQRYDILKQHCELDEKGEIVVDMEDPIPNQAKFSSPERREQFNKAVNALYDEPADLLIQRVKRSEIENMHSVRPAALIMLAPMFFDEEEPVAETMQVVKEQE